MFDSEEAAKRLGVKVSSLYVYVSRGLIRSHRSPDGRRSLFAVADIDRFAATRGERRTGPRTASITTAVTQITPAGPSYRGTLASSLLGRRFEEVAEFIWQSDAAPWIPYERETPSGLGVLDRLRLVLPEIAQADPVRSDHRPEPVQATARAMIVTAAGQLVDRAGASAEVGHLGSVASRLAAAMRPSADRAAFTAALDATLVLLADHELASSTRAVRLAASVRSDFSDAVLAGLGVALGPMHGGSAQVVVSMLRRCAAIGVEQAIDDFLREDDRLPGFGVALYPEGDPRYLALRPFVEDVLTDGELDLLDRVTRAAASRDLPLPAVELGLGALVWASGADAAFASATFVLARIVGWAAHYLEELNEPPARFRALAAYASQ